MKLVLVSRGYPPDLAGETERSVQASARALAGRGHTVVVVSGTLRTDGGDEPSTDVDPASDARVRIVRLSRTDLHPEHWHKSASSSIPARFRAILRDEKPDLVHVHHWSRLSRDLVAHAAAERVPAVVTLHDAWSTCLIATRVRSDTLLPCDAQLAAMPCLTCAQGVPPRTPWVPLDQEFMALAMHRADLVRELKLARALLVPSRSHGELLARVLGDDAGGLEFVTLASSAALPARRERVPAPPGAGERLVLATWGQHSLASGLDRTVAALESAVLAGRVTLLVAGTFADPSFERALRARCAALDVAFLGECSVERLHEHAVARAHACVSATRVREAYGFVLAEARALGMPSVLPRAGAFTERTGSDAGTLFFEPDDPAGLVQALTRLVDERGLLEALTRSVPRSIPVPDIETLVAIYERAAHAGAPAAPADVDAWFAPRMRAFAEENWDRSAAAATPAELGL